MVVDAFLIGGCCERYEKQLHTKGGVMQFDFELIYKAYPRREHKSKGFKILAKKIKTEADYHNLARAVENYAKLIRIEQRERKYTMMWTTFCNNFEDYIDPNDLGLVDESAPALVFE